MKTFPHLWQYLAEFFLEWEIFQISVVEKIRSHILCSVAFPENRAVYEMTSKTVVETEKLQIIWRRVACWVSKATRAQAHVRARATTFIHIRMHTHAPPRAHTHREICSNCCFFTATMVSRTRLIVTLCVHCLSCWTLNVVMCKITAGP